MAQRSGRVGRASRNQTYRNDSRTALGQQSGDAARQDTIELGPDAVIPPTEGRQCIAPTKLCWSIEVLGRERADGDMREGVASLCVGNAA